MASHVSALLGGGCVSGTRHGWCSVQRNSKGQWMMQWDSDENLKDGIDQLVATRGTGVDVHEVFFG
eukprot:CAMPEP_0174305224 /NCGR_PEP_ID=MMETSP0809-20121228/61283_1 /TAXON_ID=73025 ORGANISM="Eutreptiella gymnastica-like, Strain CCMP1594" /NCGR_SAMPLE_ID=MMETSP0809 /ASSEMBLY_ACC=CAM_ASM_000658 /LENGTH=65 /DNA_ID=CAMNT_0015411657 /DNA_START=513 /DNA_END=710 /DNA_ORIENTATION=+